MAYARPDPFGEPRPPAAPRSGVACRYPTVAVHLDPRRPGRRWRIGPAGRPPLEAVVVPNRGRAAEAGSLTAGLAVLYLLVVGFFVWWGGMGWGLAALVWAGLVAATFLWRYATSGVPEPVVAGADWLGVGAGRGARVLPLYELTWIDAGPDHDLDGEDIEGTTALTLRAADPGPTVQVDLAMLQANPALWDLVHQGIRSSVAAGAELTEAASTLLGGGQSRSAWS